MRDRGLMKQGAAGIALAAVLAASCLGPLPALADPTVSTGSGSPHTSDSSGEVSGGISVSFTIGDGDDGGDTGGDTGGETGGETGGDGGDIVVVPNQPSGGGAPTALSHLGSGMVPRTGDGTVSYAPLLTGAAGILLLGVSLRRSREDEDEADGQACEGTEA